MSPARAGTSAVVAVVGAAGLLLVLVTWAASIGPDRVVSGGHLDPVEPTHATATVASADPVDPADEARERAAGQTPPGWVGGLALLLEILTVAVAGVLVLRLLHKLHQLWRGRTRRRRGPPEVVPFEVLGSAAHVAEALEEGAAEQRVELAEVGEPRNAIVACWHRFEEQASRGGVERRSWQTTAEFVLGVLDLVDADRGAVARLADLYREARFSDHPMTEEHRRAALEALDAVHHSLARTPVAR
jgi:hypothetical protein